MGIPNINAIFVYMMTVPNFDVGAWKKMAPKWGACTFRTTTRRTRARRSHKKIERQVRVLPEPRKVSKQGGVEKRKRTIGKAWNLVWKRRRRRKKY